MDKFVLVRTTKNRHMALFSLRLALTMSSNLNFEGMKSALKRLFVSQPIHHKHDDI